MTMLEAMPGAYALAMPEVMPSPQCTDGRTDGQDVEPPHLRNLLPLCDACETSGEIFALVEVFELAADPKSRADACRAAMGGAA